MDYRDHKKGRTNTNFWFRGKRKLISSIMLKLSSSFDKKPLKILNLGAGIGDDLKILNKYGDNYIIDIDKKALDLIDKSLYKEKKVADACNLPFKDNFFDIVVSFDVLEHIQEDDKAVLEIYRVLKKCGKLFFTVPAYPSLYSSHDKALYHKRRYNQKMLKNLLSPFSSLKLYYWNSILFPLIALMRFSKRNSKPKVGNAEIIEPINTLFYYFLLIDNFLIKNNIKPPFGLSLIGFCKK